MGIIFKRSFRGHKFKLEVDDCDLPAVAAGSVRVNRHSNGPRVVFRLKSGKFTNISRVIMNAPLGQEVDHIDGNSMNNRRSNLRICSRAENQRNLRLHRDSTTGFKGVTTKRAAKEKRYYAQISHNNKRYALGYFSEKEDAARAYDNAAKIYHGEFARLNFPKAVI